MKDELEVLGHSANLSRAIWSNKKILRGQQFSVYHLGFILSFQTSGHLLPEVPLLEASLLYNANSHIRNETSYSDQHLQLPEEVGRCGTGFQLRSQVTLHNMTQWHTATKTWCKQRNFLLFRCQVEPHIGRQHVFLLAWSPLRQIAEGVLIFITDPNELQGPDLPSTFKAGWVPGDTSVVEVMRKVMGPPSHGTQPRSQKTKRFLR